MSFIVSKYCIVFQPEIVYLIKFMLYYCVATDDSEFRSFNNQQATKFSDQVMKNSHSSMSCRVDGRLIGRFRQISCCNECVESGNTNWCMNEQPENNPHYNRPNTKLRFMYLPPTTISFSWRDSFDFNIIHSCCSCFGPSVIMMPLREVLTQFTCFCGCCFC